MTGLAVALALSAVAFVLYLYFGTVRVEVTEHVIETDKPIAEELRIVQLSDLHGRSRFWTGTASEIVASLKPDIVCVTGDLFNRLDQLPGVLKDLSRLDAPHLYFVPGNHERQDVSVFRRRKLSEAEFREVMKRIGDANFTILENNGERIDVNDSEIFVYGFDNSLYGKERYKLQRNCPEAAYRIVLAHSPSIARWMNKRGVPYDLLLTGHTHGGQIAPLRIFLGHYRNSHVGMKRLGEGRHFYINRGLGTIHLPFRIGCRPEVALFRIKGRSSNQSDTGDS